MAILAQGKLMVGIVGTLNTEGQQFTEEKMRCKMDGTTNHTAASKQRH